MGEHVYNDNDIVGEGLWWPSGSGNFTCTNKPFLGQGGSINPRRLVDRGWPNAAATQWTAVAGNGDLVTITGNTFNYIHNVDDEVNARNVVETEFYSNQAVLVVPDPLPTTVNTTNRGVLWRNPTP